MKKDILADYVHFAPPVLFLAAAALVAQSGASAVFEPPYLLPVLNTTFLMALPFVVAFFCVRTYARGGSLMFVLFGCGMVALGTGSLLAGWGLSRYGQDMTVTIHNIGSFLGGFFHLGGVVSLALLPRERAHKSGRAAAALCMLGYLVSALLPLMAALLVVKGSFPIFFVQGQGPTFTRQLVLTLAWMAYLVCAIRLFVLHVLTRAQLPGLYSIGLFLLAVGLASVTAERNVGSLIGWIGRAAQYLGGLYLVGAMLAGIRESRRNHTTLPDYLREVFRSQIEEEVNFRTRELSELNRRLKKSEAMYRTSIEDSLQGFAIAQDGRIVLCNDALCVLSGHSAREICAMTAGEVLATVYPADRSRVLTLMRQAGEDAARLPAQVIRFVKKSGESMWIQVLCAKTTYQARPALQLTCLDRTEEIRVAAEYRSLFDHALNGMAVLQGGRIQFANQALADLCGYSVQELLSLNAEQVAGLVHPDERDGVIENMSRRSAGGDVPTAQDIRFIHKDGSIRLVQTFSSRVEHRGAPAVQVTYRDTTAEQAASGQLERAHRNMRNLAAHLLRVREEERRSVAQEIHDQLGQVLAAIKMDLHWIAKRLDARQEVVREKFRGIIALSEEASGAVHRIAADLRPRILDDLGLAPALDWLGTDFARRTGIACTTRTDFPPELVGGNAGTALYRIVQEALANVGRHSRADHVTVRLSVSDGVLHLMVEDDGVGISADRAAAADSYGLIGMRERVEALGGNLSIGGEPGLGTILVVRIPFSSEGVLK